jgi:hypothetical protein
MTTLGLHNVTLILPFSLLRLAVKLIAAIACPLFMLLSEVEIQQEKLEDAAAE